MPRDHVISSRIRSFSQLAIDLIAREADVLQQLIAQLRKQAAVDPASAPLRQRGDRAQQQAQQSTRRAYRRNRAGRRGERVLRRFEIGHSSSPLRLGSDKGALQRTKPLSLPTGASVI